MENTQLLPSTRILELDDDLHQSSNIEILKKRWKESCKCASRKKIVNTVVCISSCIIFIGLLAFMYLGKFIKY